MSSDEEADYMSEDFLKQCEAASSKSSLIADRNRQRKIAIEKKQQDDRVKYKKVYSRKAKEELEVENRIVGLETSISTESKGFAMLQKMGYKPGSGLGKSGEGRIEPVPVEIKTGRGGIGRDEALRKVQERKHAMEESRYKSTVAKYSDVEEFRALQRQKLNAKLDFSDLAKSQSACEKLDIEHGVEAPAERWFWQSTALAKIADDDYDEDGEFQPKKKRPQPEEASRDDEEYESSEDLETETVELSVAEKLELLTQYLRLVYSYCVWCGVSYSNLKELQECCPGNKREEH